MGWEMEVILGGLGFAFFLLLWGILPHRIHQARRSNSDGSIPSPHQVEALRVEAEGVKAEANRVVRVPSVRSPAGLSVDDRLFHLRVLPNSSRNGGPWGVLEGQIGGWGFRVPVFFEQVRINGTLRERYRARIWGCRCEATAIPDFREQAEDVFRALEYAGQLPLYALQRSEPHDPALIPIYPWGEGWRVHEPDGPILEAMDLGTLRRRVADAHGLPVEAVQVRVLSEELAWVPPAAVFRPAVGWGPWMPVAWSGTSWRLHLAGAPLSAPGDGAGIWSLWKVVAARGLERGWLRVPEDLALEVWSAAAWEVLASALPEAMAGLRFYASGPRFRAVLLPVYRYEDRWMAVYAEEDRWTIFVGGDPADLWRRVGEALHAAGCLADPQALRLEMKRMEKPAQAERAFPDLRR
ncbi:MAG: hypothetical protein KNN16_06400 [Thermoflexus hugenholtzii]|uniref:hypothetical protein n=1 Tax=Thermoflexus TaxID=1495649 RepID=UPI001C775B3A|nr:MULTISPECIES: hypothetical protein [Thermoflexus]QWK11919.1 MAG: hypothetical protein KNN16_06400 [Thermoflexus hugenholtzii]